MKPGDVYYAKDGKVFKVVPDLARILNPENPTCIGCAFNNKKDQKTFTEADCTPALDESGIFKNEWEYCEVDIIFKEVTDDELHET